jgi:hypothetical protein
MGDGVYWRGRWWRIAGGDDGDEDDGGDGQPGDAAGALAAAQARIAELEQQTADLEGARARIAELEAAAGELEAARAAASEAAGRELAAHRRALLAEHRGSVVEELISGSTTAEMDASVETARTAYAWIADLVRQDLAGQVVPPGATERGTADLDGLSPLQKITRGLSKG